MADYDIQKRIRLAPRNPWAFARVGIDYIESRLNGQVVPDPLSPLVQGVEIASAMAAAQIEESMLGDRRSYPLLSRTMRDLYSNASDYDMLTRWSQPAKAKIHILLPREEIINQMVTVPGSELRKVVIPRNTSIIIDSKTTLVTLYPIEIRQPMHKGVANIKAPLQVVYNTDLKSPLQKLDDNIVEWNTLRALNGREFLDITIDMLQLTRTVTKESIEGGSYFFDLPYDDYYHNSRVFVGTDDGGWKEINTTYSEFVYSAKSPTAIVTVQEKVVSFRIPPVYIQQGLIPAGSSIRFDVYTTKGPLNTDLSVLQGVNFKASFTKDEDDATLEPYSAPIRSLEFSLYSTGYLTGGTLGLTFTQMQAAIINNISIIDIPITPVQIESRLNMLGFDVIKHRDDLTDRVYLASKTLAPSPDSIFSSAPSSGIMTFQSKLEDIVNFPGIYDNGNRITITPKTLFRIDDGIPSLVKADDYPDKASPTTESMLNMLNSGIYAFSPFYYVLDTNDENFALRAYRLEDPQQTTRDFVHENESSQLEIATTAFDIERTDTGYLLTVIAQVGPNWQAVKQTYAQLGFIPFGELNYAYLNGTYKGRITQNNITYDTWEFPIHCTFDLDSNDNLIVDNFAIFDTLPRHLPMPLMSEFTLTYSVSGYLIEGLKKSDVDGYLGKYLLPNDVIGVTAEKVGLTLGTALKSFWSNSRPLGWSGGYKTYDQDVLATWEDDVFEIDPVSKARKFTIDSKGNVVFNKLHSKGDPVIVDGKQSVLFPKGTPILDTVTGNPIPLGNRPIMRLMDIFLVDGLYYYANDTNSQADFKYISDSIVNTYLPSLDELSKRKLEKTDIFMYPKKTLSKISVLVDDANPVTVQSQLSFVFTLYATESGYEDSDFKTMVESICNSAITLVLRNATVSDSTIISKVVQNVDDRLKGFTLKMFSDGNEVTTFTTVDDSYRATVKRIAALNDDGKIIVKEDIKFNWELHIPDV